MNKSIYPTPLALRKSTLIPTLIILVMVLTSLGCGLQIASLSGDLPKTQTALSVQQTHLAETSSANANATITAQQATIVAQNALVTSAALTQAALLIQSTMPPEIPATPEAPYSPTQEYPMTTSAPSEGDFPTMMKNAQILLFEDIVNNPRMQRYVQDTLNYMGLQYKDDGSAKGWLKSDLLSGAPNGQPWDLIILALEAEEGVQGEFFDYLLNNLNQGSAVIMESWHLDEISEGRVKPILDQCGVGVYAYFGKTGTPNDLIMWPTGVPHPILSQPNSGMSFTNVVDTWPFWDLGDLMYITGSGDAQLLLGTTANDATKDGGLAVCMGGHLTLQTFSSHSFTYDTMRALWENYIYNALKIRLTGSY